MSGTPGDAGPADAGPGDAGPGGTGRPGLAVVVMGVAGSGKSAVGSALAEALGARFVEGDRLHPPANVARMARGEPLGDEHRAGWLDAVAAELGRATATGGAAVAACSALKRRYRDRLSAALGRRIAFVHLATDPATARLRVGSRKGHFMPASLVDSQFADLEEPQPDEGALTLDASRPVAVLAAEAAARLSAPASPG